MTLAHGIEKINLTTIRMTRVDPESFTDVEGSPETVRFGILLNAAPAEGWITVFHTLYDRSKMPVRPPVEVIGDRLWIDYLPRYDEELEGFLDALNGIFALTNDDIRKTAEIESGIHADPTKQRFRQRLLTLEL